MWLLLGTTITASFFDSLNPSAIAQQMLLQAMVKQKRHTLYFILGIARQIWQWGWPFTTALPLGLRFCWKSSSALIRSICTGAAVAVGLLCLAVGIRLVVKTARNTKYSRAENETKAPVRLSPLALFGMGRRFLRRGIDERVPVFRLYRNAFGLCAAVSACSAFYTSV